MPRFRSALFALVLCCAASSAHAAMIFCNRTQSPLEAALGYRETVDWISEGWWRIEPGQCARVFGKPLTQRFYFYYAAALTSAAKDKPPVVWKGKYQFCADEKAFKVEGDENCAGRGFQVKGFQEVDVGANTRDYTLDFKDGSEGE